MNRLPGPRFLNTILLGGDTVDKLEAVAAAGFAQVELWREDVASSSVADVRKAVARTGLQLTDVQVLLDFDGASAATRQSKRAEAMSLLALANDVGAGTVLVPACTATDYAPERVADDLRWLCLRAAEHGLRIAYEGMAWSRLHSTLPSAWQQIEQVGAPNLDIVVDAFHLFAAGRTADDLHDIPAERIALVQLSDALAQPLPGQVTTQARHHRCLPGDGLWPLETLIDALAEMGYSGPIGLEVFNDALKARDPHEVAREAMAALEAVLAH